MEALDQFTITTLRVATPLVYAAVAGLFSIRAGIFHLGIEGLILAGAFSAVGFGNMSGSIWIGLACAVLTCLVLSWLYWLVIEVFKADTVIAGLGLTALCVGATAFAMQTIFGARGQMASTVRIPKPVSGPQEGALAYVSELTVLTWFAPVFVLIAWIVLRRSRLGLQISAVGDYPYGAEAAGLNIARTKLYAVLITGFGCALAGAQLSTGDIAIFTEGMSNGRGFFALAAILFGQLSAVFVALASLFFGFAEAFGISIQISVDGGIPRQFVLMVPFVLTIVIVSITGYLKIVRNRR